MQQHLDQQSDGTVCAFAVIVKDGRILVGHRHYTKEVWEDVSVWTCPGGRCDQGERVEDGLKREAAEEIGVNDLSIVDHICDAPGAKEGDDVKLFYCTTGQEPTLMEPEKFSEWRWVPIKQYADEGYGNFNPQAREKLIQYISSL